jgi:hypothetical protein
MKFRILFFFLLAACISFAQSPRVLTIKKANPISKEIYVFPKVIVPNSSLASQKINNKLRDYVLGVSDDVKDTNIFDSVWRTTYRMENISDLSFKVSEVNASIISLTISGQGCGAYCEAFNYYFTFNTQTGNQLTLDSLFTREGLKTFVKVLNENKKQRLNKKLKEINHSLTLANVKTDTIEKERLFEMLSMYTDCLTKTIDIEFMSDIQFLIKKGKITVYSDRCSAHYNMAYDDLWTFVYSTDLKNLKKLLNRYGLSLIKN